MTTPTVGIATLTSVGRMTVPTASVIPQGVGAPPPPGLDPKKGKLMCIKVRMLDDTMGVFHLGHKAVGQALFDEVCRHLNLLECDYFGLEFLDCYNNRCWLDKEKSILKQITSARSDARFSFIVKFYTPTPADLEEEYTRYLFALQIKRDLSSGQFVCNENTAALMASYIVQSECGDFSSDDYYDHSYLSSVRFIPNQSAEFEKKVMESHKKIIGMSPAESDLALLETARRSEFYGVKFHAARDIEGTPASLAVLHLGIKVYHQLSCANTFSWAKVRKLSFKRKRLFIKLHPESYAYYKDTIEFGFETRNECKMFWKKCVEHHAFFRCSEIAQAPKHHTKFFTKGSSFRYSGRTQRQLIDYVREHHKRREPFTRPIHSSMTRKIFNDERMLPTPVSSLPGTLTRENGNLSSANYGQSIGLSEDEQHLPTYASLMNDREIHHENLERRQMESVDQEASEIGAAHLPPTPETPKLKRKAKEEAERNPVANGSPSAASSRANNHVQDVIKDGVSVYSISSPFRKGMRMQSIESSSSGQLTLTGSSQQLPPSTNSATSQQTPTKKQSVRGFDFPSDASDIFSNNNNYENVLNSSNDARAMSSSEMPDFTPRSTSDERNIPIRLIDDAESSISTQNTTFSRAKTKRRCSSKAFCIAKELLMTERTYFHDLSIVAKNFKAALATASPAILEPKPADTDQQIMREFFAAVDQLTEFHEGLLEEMERRVTIWETKLNQLTPSTPTTPSSEGVQKIGDILLCAVHNSYQSYFHYITRAGTFLASFYDLCRNNRPVETARREFETQKLCYVPVNFLMLKPIQRILAYEATLTRLVAHYMEEGGLNPDLSDGKVALEKLSVLINSSNAKTVVNVTGNFVKLAELERDLTGVENLVQPNRTFICEGFMYRFTRKDPVQRLFVLFNDCLLYASRAGGASTLLTFRIHGQIPLRGLMLEDGDPFRMSTASLQKNAFTIFGGNKTLVVATNAAEDKHFWLENISRCVMDAKESKEQFPTFPSLRSSGSVDDVTTSQSPTSSNLLPGSVSTFKATTGPQEDSAAVPQSPTLSGERQWYYRANNSLHVCWHRQTTLSADQWHKSGSRCQMSGYLLRKFRTSSGWQRLWVVLCEFCLFFYKNHQEIMPLASLPLLGYAISSPDAKDDLNKNFVFKLHYKTHYYFFRADNDYTFNRWLEVLRVVCADQREI